MLRIIKSAEGYTAEASPPHTMIDYTSGRPLGPVALILELGLVGARASDINAALSEADPYWNSAPPPSEEIPAAMKELAVGE